MAYIEDNGERLYLPSSINRRTVAGRSFARDIVCVRLFAGGAVEEDAKASRARQSRARPRG